jgi:hypothetical protein
MDWLKIMHCIVTTCSLISKLLTIGIATPTHTCCCSFLSLQVGYQCFVLSSQYAFSTYLSLQGLLDDD